MMSHLPILPILIPMLAAILMLLPPFASSTERQRLLGVVTLIAVIICAVQMLKIADTGTLTVYQLGDWQPPFGIVLIVDRLSAMMVTLTALLAFGAMIYAAAGEDRKGMFFYPLFMFQVMGVVGAFLTGDIFNLFVFFEVLLIASYALLIHGGGKQKTQASVHYLMLNLVGSSLFLIALGILYGTLGTLNMADMALKVRNLPEAEQHLTRIGALMLLVVFGLKSAMFPLHFWLARTYASASAPIAAIFAIMTKVGIYSILRVHVVMFGDGAGELANLVQPWIWPAAVLTLLMGTLGALASQSLRQLVSYLVIISVGTLLCAIAVNTPESTAAALYYLVHSTFVSGALFLIADAIAGQRGKATDRFVRSRRMPNPLPLGIAFMVAALSITGLPPFSGFVGKIWVLQSAETQTAMIWVWPSILIASLMSVVAASRAGSTLFWRVSSDRHEAEPVGSARMVGIWALLLASPLLVALGGPVAEYMSQTAVQLRQLGIQPELLLPVAPNQEGL
jgi:multicomponent K+:H+ antiporter subunit D